MPSKKLGHNSNLTLLPLTVSTKQMQGESAAIAGYFSANATVGHTEDQMAEATIGALSNF
jgi:hypothetical protein